MRRLMICLILGLAMQVGPASALDADEEKLLDYQTAMAIDANCHFLKHFELSHTYPISSDLIDQVSWGVAFGSGKISADEYDARYRAIEEQGRAIAATVNCVDQQAAAHYIVPLRDQIAREIYANLLIAFEFGQLTPEQQDAARRYEAMIAPLYGQNWQGFVQYAQGQARRILEAAREKDAENDIYGFGLYDSLLSDPYGEEEDLIYSAPIDSWNFDLQVKGSVRVVNDILFEVVAESQLYRLISRREGDRPGYIKSLVNAGFEPQMDLFEGPAPYTTLEGGPEVQLIMVIKADGDMRVMTFGQDAAQLKTGSLVLMVQPDALPTELGSNYAHITSLDWWESAQEFRGELVAEPCLGGPCFAFPRDIIDAFLAGDQQQSFRFYLSSQPNVAAPDFDNPAIQIGYTYQLRARQDFLSAGQ